MSKKYKKNKLAPEDWGLAAGCFVISIWASAMFNLSGFFTSCIFVILYIGLQSNLQKVREKKEQELLNKQMEIRKRYLEEQKRIEEKNKLDAEKKALLEKEKKKNTVKTVKKEHQEKKAEKSINKDKKIEQAKENSKYLLANDIQKNKYPYIIDYLNENEFKKLERSIKKYNMLAYKKLCFDYYPSLRQGKFLGKLVLTNEKEQSFNYELELPTDDMFKKIYGSLVLHYTVYKNQKIIILNTFTPEKILKDGHKDELVSYKGVMVSKQHGEKDMFKINLLNMLDKK